MLEKVVKIVHSHAGFWDWKPERATAGAKRLASRSPKRNGREEMSEESVTGHRIRVVIDGIRKLCVCLPWLDMGDAFFIPS